MKVTIYSTPTCPWCKKEKDYLKSKEVKFDDVDVAADQAKAQEMIEKSGQMAVPVTVIAKAGSEDVIVGFNQSKLDELLEL